MATEYSRSPMAERTNSLVRLSGQENGTSVRVSDLFDNLDRFTSSYSTTQTASPGPGGMESYVDGSDPSVRSHPTFEARSEIWRSFREGQISFAEAQRRSAKIGVLAENPEHPARPVHGAPGKPRPPVARPRETRPEPNASRQYSNPMATTAARDDRLTPQAKALLQVIRARAGKGSQTQTTKGTLAAILARSTRSITRYLRDLERCGYLKTRTRADHRGLHLGLVLTITEKVMPFYSNLKKLGAWLGESAGLKPVVPFMPFATGEEGEGSRSTSYSKADRYAYDTEVFEDKGVTLLSSKNQSHKDSSVPDSNGLRRTTGVDFAASD